MRKDWFEDDNEIRLLHRGKRRLLDIVFGRTMVITLLLVLQIAIMVLGAHYLGRYYPALTIVLRVLSVAVIIYLVNKSGSATTKITWIILVMALPAFGVLLYLFVQLDIGHRYANRRVQESILSTVQYVPRQTELMARLRTELPEVHNLAEYTLRSGDYPVYENTAVTYYPMGQDKIGALIEALQSAEHFIFLEYFIIEEGDVWGRILKILEERVRAGVEVRVLYDGTCTFYRLPDGVWYVSGPWMDRLVSTVNFTDYESRMYFDKSLRDAGIYERMEALGIRCKMFAPLRPLVSTYYNNRDHRKIAVIDGRVGFTGGVNLADEYANLVSVYGVWKDTAVRLEGEAVRSLTLMFLQMWGMDEREPDTDSYGRYLNVPLRPLPGAGGYVLPYADSPLDDERVGECVYLDILNHAERYVRIFTPYLILDETMVMALTFAAKRGVDVELILPHVPDKKFAFALAKGHYRELLDAGVKIYEYTPGFVHAKVFVSDDRKAVVGTINLDYRSLYLHFEDAVYLYDCPCIKDIVADFDATRAQSQIVTHGDLARIPLHTRIAAALLKLVAPLM